MVNLSLRAESIENGLYSGLMQQYHSNRYSYYLLDSKLCIHAGTHARYGAIDGTMCRILLVYPVGFIGKTCHLTLPPVGAVWVGDSLRIHSGNKIKK